jgi:tetratricopeptide (TPR) repeat protein
MSTAAAPGRDPEFQPPEKTPATGPDKSPGSIKPPGEIPGEKQERKPELALRLWRSLSSQYFLYFLVLVAGIAAWQARKPVTVIAPFQVPEKGSVPFTGETVANVLGDRLAQIHEQIEKQAKDQKLHATDMHSLGQAGLPIPPNSKNEEYSRGEVATRFTVEVKGLSYQAVVGTARAVLGTQTNITGDMILEGGNDGGTFTLIARTEREGPWQSAPQARNVEGLKLASEDLAEQILETREPGLAGVLFLNEGQAQRALAVLKRASERVKREGRQDEAAARIAVCVGMEANELYADAMGCYKEILEQKLGRPAEIEERMAQAHWLSGDDPKLTTRRTEHEKKEAAGFGNTRESVLNEFDNLANTQGYARAFLGWGKALDDLGKHDEALRAYDQFLRMPDATDPRDRAVAHVGRATAFSRLGDHEGALKEYDEALVAIPGDALVLVRRGLEQADAGDLDAGITELQKVVAKNESKDVTAFAAFQLGALFERKSAWSMASEQYRLTTKMRPEFSQGHGSLARSLVREGRIDDARTQFRETARQSSNEVDRRYVDVLAHQWLGNSLQDLCYYDRAAVEYKEAVRLKPDYRAAHSELGNVYAQRGQMAQAIEEYEKALDAKPNELDVVEWFVRTRVRLGEALVSQGKVQEGLAELRAAVMMEPKRVEWRLALGKALYGTGNYPEAASIFGDAVDLNKEDVEAHYDWALALGKQGLGPEATAQCGIVFQLRPDDPKYQKCPLPASKRGSSACSPK